MREDVDQESELRRYLLGELTLEEQVLLEQRLFLDTEYAQLAQSVEDDLIDDYVRDDLTAAEREKFETRFRNQADSNDISIAQALDRYLASEPAAGQGADSPLLIPTLRPREAGATTNIPDDDHRVTVLPTPPRRNRFVWLALAAGVLIILSLITWKVFQSIRRPAAEPFQAEGPQPAPNQSASPQQQPAPSQQTAEQGRTPEPNKTPSNERDRKQSERKPGISFATVTIFPSGGTRGLVQSSEVTIPAEAKNVLLKLPVVTVRNYEKYHFELSGNGRVLAARNLNVSVDEKLDRIVSVQLPNKLFKEQSYEIRLRGLPTGESTTYAFTVKKQQ